MFCIAIKPEQQTLDSMSSFDLVVIEEVGQVSCAVFERLLRLWDAAARRPALAFVGDFAQLRGVEPTRALESPRWRQVRKLQLHHMRRCKCKQLKWKLELLRTAKPSRQQLRKIKAGHKAPSMRYRIGYRSNAVPTSDEIKAVFAETPLTTFVTITRAAAAWVNQLAVEHFYGDSNPLSTVPGDPDSNPANFDGTRQTRHEPIMIPIHRDLRVMLTKNVNKDTDFVNGMGATVLGVHSAGVRVRTDTGYILMVYPWTDEDHNVFLPLRIGYANTLMKLQGATLKHMTLYLDVPNVEAAGYVALSRVQRDRDWRFVGDPTAHHLTPASGF